MQKNKISWDYDEPTKIKIIGSESDYQTVFIATFISWLIDKWELMSNLDVNKLPNKAIIDVSDLNTLGIYNLLLEYFDEFAIDEILIIRRVYMNFLGKKSKKVINREPDKLEYESRRILANTTIQFSEYFDDGKLHYFHYEFMSVFFRELFMEEILYNCILSDDSKKCKFLASVIMNDMDCFYKKAYYELYPKIRKIIVSKDMLNGPRFAYLMLQIQNLEEDVIAFIGDAIYPLLYIKCLYNCNYELAEKLFVNITNNVVEVYNESFEIVDVRTLTGNCLSAINSNDNVWDEDFSKIIEKGKELVSYYNDLEINTNVESEQILAPSNGIVIPNRKRGAREKSDDFYDYVTCKDKETLKTLLHNLITESTSPQDAVEYLTAAGLCGIIKMNEKGKITLPFNAYIEEFPECVMSSSTYSKYRQTVSGPNIIRKKLEFDIIT